MNKVETKTQYGERRVYCAPCVEVVAISVEQGIASSTPPNIVPDWDDTEPF